ncbi:MULTISPECIES: hypothetical protein [Fischerella]|uniref:hypothetical protein n=1 Tax=Fischerella TaxID=1190 RepID=UPI0002F2B8CB|nr:MULTISPECIES: hypothetical protein [Fischerella]
MIGQDSIQTEKKTCPHLGQEFQPFVQPQLDDPYSFFQRAREEEPIFHSPILNGYVLTRYEDILNVLKDPTKFSSADNLKPIALLMQFGEHKQSFMLVGFLPLSRL